MTPRVIVLGGLVGAGLLVVVGLWVRDMGRELQRRSEIIAGLTAAQDHQGCLAFLNYQGAELDRLRDYASHLEHRLDHDLDAEYRELCEGGGS
jgi:hypothetical protein